MEVKVCGGVREHGRNCFLLKGSSEYIMLDCGIAGGMQRQYPDISETEAQSCQHLFLTHSHMDHCGAIAYAVQKGFRGKVWCSQDTYNQLVDKPSVVCILEEQGQEGRWISIHDHLSMLWGRSAHCEGSVWYELRYEDKQILYSGDYDETMIDYPCTPIRNRYADLAILDCAYGYEIADRIQLETQLLQACQALLQQHKRIMLPLPLYGRGKTIYRLLKQLTANIGFDDCFLTNHHEPWLQEAELISQAACDILFLGDAQLAKEQNQHLATTWLTQGNAILFTGECDQSSFAYQLLQQKHCMFFRIPVHQHIKDLHQLIVQNQFHYVLPFHHKEMDSIMVEDRQFTLRQSFIF